MGPPPANAGEDELKWKVRDVIDAHDALRPPAGAAAHVSRGQIDVEKGRHPKTPAQIKAVIRQRLNIVVFAHDGKRRHYFPSGAEEAERGAAVIDAREVDPGMQLKIGNENLVASHEVESLFFVQKILDRFLIEVPLIVIPGRQGRQDIGPIKEADLDENRRADQVRILPADHALGVQVKTKIEPLKRPQKEAGGDAALAVKSESG